jgi:anti-sigma factor RsiW
MRCREVQPLLSDFIEDQLPPATTRQVLAHLEHCAECQYKCRALRQVIAALEVFPVVAEPADLTARVMAQIPTRRVPPRLRVRRADVIISTVGAGLLWGTLAAWELWSAIFRRELGSVLAKAQPYLRLVTSQLHDTWVPVADRLGTPVGNAWWVLMFGVAATILAVMAVRERRAWLRI